MGKSEKLPAIQFYTGDWMKDPAVRCVSLSARGLWIDMLCLMHESPRRGVLLLANGRVMSEQQVLRMCGADNKEGRAALRELEEAGAFSRDDDGAIFCRRMVRDEEVRQKRALGGHKGGNPALLKVGEKDNLPANLAGNLRETTDAEKVGEKDNQIATPSSSSSFSISKKSKNPPKSPQGESARRKSSPKFDPREIALPPPLDTAAFRSAWIDWCDDRQDRRKPITKRAATLQIAKLAEVGEQQAIAAIRTAIERGWQGLFPDSSTQKGAGRNGSGKRSGYVHDPKAPVKPL